MGYLSIIIANNFLKGEVNGFRACCSVNDRIQAAFGPLLTVRERKRKKILMVENSRNINVHEHQA